MHKNMLVLSFVMMVNALSYGIIIPLLYPYAARYGLNATGLALLFASFSATQFIATPIIGRLSDRYGRKPLLLICVLGSSITLALFASATSIAMLFVARILDGITGGNVSVAQAAIADSTKPHERAKAFGMLGAAFGFGFTFGPAIGGVLSQFGLSAPFWFAAALALTGTVLAKLFLSETNHNRETKVGLRLFEFRGLLEALFRPVTGPIFLIGFISLIALNTFILGFQSYTVDVLALTPARIGILFTLLGIVSMLMQIFGIRILLKTIQNKLVMVQGGLILSAMVLLLTLFNVNFALFAMIIMLFGIANAPISPVLTAMLSARAKPEDQGGIMGFNQAYASLAQVIGPLLAGVIISRSVIMVFAAAAVLYLASLLPTKFVRGKDTVDL